MIKLHQVNKYFGENLVLHGINASINKGEIYGLVGSSGAGKSTLLRCINGLVKIDVGTIQVDGTEISHLTENELRPVRRDIGMIFQHFSLINRLTVAENISLPMESWDYDKVQIQERVEELLRLVGLTDKADSFPRELSGGQKQRVAIARAIAMNPKILLCDEPTSALDPRIADSILELLKDVNQQFGITIVIVTHQMEVVKKICDRIMILDKGKIMNEGPVVDIFMAYPPSLRKLLGKDDTHSLPIKGHNIKFVFDTANEADILSDISKDTGIPYRYVWGGIEQFKNQYLGMIIINIESENLTDIQEYFDHKNIRYQEVS